MIGSSVRNLCVYVIAFAANFDVAATEADLVVSNGNTEQTAVPLAKGGVGKPSEVLPIDRLKWDRLDLPYIDRSRMDRAVRHPVLIRFPAEINKQ